MGRSYGRPTSLRRVGGFKGQLPQARNESAPPAAFEMKERGVRTESDYVAPHIREGEKLASDQGQLFTVRGTPQINIAGTGEGQVLRPIRRNSDVV